MEASITARLAQLQQMTVAGLQAEYEELLGRPTKSRNKKQLFRQLARMIQDTAAGSTPETAKDAVPKPTLTVKFERKTKGKQDRKAAKAQPKKTTRAKPAGQRDSRLPKVGTTITKEWHGKKLLVRVLEDGFEYEGQPFRSLSGLAKHITGQIINGFLFFAVLGKEGKKS
jgi:hypothetical protein